MAKSVRIGNASFTPAGYKKFVSLSKEQQIKQISGGFAFKDDRKAAKLLAHIPNGDISSGNEEKVSEDNTGDGSRPGGGLGADGPKDTPRKERGATGGK